MGAKFKLPACAAVAPGQEDVYDVPQACYVKFGASCVQGQAGGSTDSWELVKSIELSPSAPSLQ